MIGGLLQRLSKDIRSLNQEILTVSKCSGPHYTPGRNLSCSILVAYPRLQNKAENRNEVQILSLPFYMYPWRRKKPTILWGFSHFKSLCVFTDAEYLCSSSQLQYETAMVVKANNTRDVVDSSITHHL